MEFIFMALDLGLEASFGTTLQNRKPQMPSSTKKTHGDFQAGLPAYLSD